MIVAGFDGSAAARAAVEWAADDALRKGMPLRIVHAVDRWPYQIAKFPPQEWPDAMIRAGEKLLAEAEAVPALAYAFEQAALRGSMLRAIHAWQLPMHMYSPAIAYDLDDLRASQLRLVAEAIAPHREKHPDVRIVEDVRQVHPVEALTEASAQADLVVVGSHSRNALERALLGSVSRGVLHHAHCPVAVIRTA